MNRVERKKELATMIISDAIQTMLETKYEVKYDETLGQYIDIIAKEYGINQRKGLKKKDAFAIMKEVVRSYIDPLMTGKMISEIPDLDAHLSDEKDRIAFQDCINTLVEYTYEDIEYRCDDCDRIIGSRCKRGLIYYGYKHTDGREFCTYCYGKYNKKHKPSKEELKTEAFRQEIATAVQELQQTIEAPLRAVEDVIIATRKATQKKLQKYFNTDADTAFINTDGSFYLFAAGDVLLLRHRDRSLPSRIVTEEEINQYLEFVDGPGHDDGFIYRFK